MGYIISVCKIVTFRIQFASCHFGLVITSDPCLFENRHGILLVSNPSQYCLLARPTQSVLFETKDTLIQSTSDVLNTGISKYPLITKIILFIYVFTLLLSHATDISKYVSGTRKYALRYHRS